MTDLMNELMNYGAVYRTAPATPGLLIKGDTQLTVVMWCKNCYRKSVAQSSSDFRRRPPPQ